MSFLTELELLIYVTLNESISLIVSFNVNLPETGKITAIPQMQFFIPTKFEQHANDKVFSVQGGDEKLSAPPLRFVNVVRLVIISPFIFSLIL